MFECSVFVGVCVCARCRVKVCQDFGDVFSVLLEKGPWRVRFSTTPQEDPSHGRFFGQVFRHASM